MFKMLFIGIINGFIIHTDLDIYKDRCKKKYNEKVDIDISDYFLKISNYIQETYGTMFDDYLDDIIVVPENKKFIGRYCHPSTIVLAYRYKFKSTLDHELMHLINYNIRIFDNEWDKLNVVGHVKKYKKYDLRKGFITKYGMSKRQEDIATLYEEFIHRKYSKKQLVRYDLAIMTKFKLLYKILISFDDKFLSIIDKKIIERGSMLPEIYESINTETDDLKLQNKILL